jgi:hypothetical protein
VSGRGYAKEFEEQKKLEEALSRQNPWSSRIGTGAGLVGGMLIPAGAVGRAAQAGSMGIRALTGAGVGAAQAGASSLLEKTAVSKITEKDVKDALNSSVFGGVLGGGLGAAAPKIASTISAGINKIPGIKKGAGIVDASGNFTPEVEKVILDAFGGKLNKADIDAFKPALMEVLQKKGVSESAAKEALIRSQGAPAAKTTVEGIRPTSSTQAPAQEAEKELLEKLAQKGESILGTPTSPSATAEAIAASERTAGRAGSQAFKEAMAVKGIFGEGVHSIAQQEISTALKANKIPVDLTRDPRFPSATTAMKYLEERLFTPGNLPLQQKADFENLYEVRKVMGSLWKGSSDADRRAMSIIIDGIDNTFVRSINEGLFTGRGTDLINKIEKAKKVWSKYKQDFSPHVGADATFTRSVIKKMTDPKTNKVFADLTSEPAVAQAAQIMINQNLWKPGQGAVTYNAIQRMVGDPKKMVDVNNNIKQALIGNIASYNDPKLASNELNRFLAPSNKDLAEKLFKPDELSELRRISASLDLVNKSKSSKIDKDSKTKFYMSKAAAMIGAGALGTAHIGPIAGAISAAVAPTIQKLSKSATSPIAAAKELRGAAKRPPPIRDFQKSSLGQPNITAAMPTESEPMYSEPPPLTIPVGRTARKSGGRVITGEQMVAMAERAKRELGNETKQILGADDNHVAKALEVANSQLGE